MYPKLYIESSEQSIADFNDILREYSKIIDLKKYKRIIDVGCGPGNITSELFYPYLSENIEKLIGVDISIKMVEYAQKNYGSNPKINYQTLDITTNVLSDNLQNEFDLVTSFYCVQIISDFKKVFENMYAMLKPGGDLFVYFMGKCFALDIWEDLAENSEWAPYMMNYKNKMCPVNWVKDQVEFVQNILKEIGFDVLICNKKNKEKVYKKQLFKDLMKSINNFNVPRDLQDDFISRHLDLFRTSNLVQIDADGIENFIYSYSLVIVCARKPF